MPDVLARLPDEAAEIFVDTAERTVWDVLVALALDESQYLDTQAVYEQTPEELHVHLDTLQQVTEGREWYTGRVAAEAESLFRTLIVDFARKRIDELKDLITAAKAGEDEESLRYCNRFCLVG